MSQTRIILCFFYFLFGGITLFAQNKIPTRDSVDKIITEAEFALLKLDFESSLQLSRKALSLSFLLKDDELIAKSYNEIAGSFEELTQIDRAIEYYNKALFHANKTKNYQIINWIYNNLGNVYFFDKKNRKLGIDCYKKSLFYSEKISDTVEISGTKMNLAWAYFEINDYQKGEQQLEFVDKYQNKLEGNSQKISFFMLNGMKFGNQGDSIQAKNYFQKSINLAIKSKLDLDLYYTYDEYARYLFRLKDYKNAYLNLDLYIELTNKIYDSERIKNAEITAKKLELDIYKNEIKRSEIVNKAQSEIIEKTNIIYTLFAISLAVLLMFLFSLYRMNKFRVKSNNYLLEKNKELEIAKSKAEEASLLKTQFVSTISHELRTPLYGVVGITNMLLDEHKELAKSPHLSSLKFSARYLLSLVNDILQINKIEENRIVLENLTFNITDEVDMIKNSLSFLAENNKNIFTVSIDPNIPEYLIGDKLRLAQILMNLCSNALKFTKKGNVKIIVILDKIVNQTYFLKFEVTDDGVGIAKENQDKIFEKFVQVGRKDEDYQGTGLGLSIVKRLLLLFESDIKLESTIGIGTTFSFIIGFDYDMKKTTELINNIQVDLTSSQLFNILVVEDNKINQIVTKKILEKNNYTCNLADDGFVALEKLQNEVFDAILMDINMPKMNGFETSKKIRELGIKTPIIALTAFAKDEITEQAISSGMNDIIIKPFEPMKLFQVISNQINKTKNAD